MPKRTNSFQQVVAVIHDHMAEGATVTESAMILPIRGGDEREVDVLVTAHVGGHAVLVGIEASRRKRKADVGWVEQMKAKHEDLPTNKLVLYSASGFTKGALAKATEHGIVAIGAEELTEGEVGERVLGVLHSIWPKLISLTPERAKVWVRTPEGEVQWFKAPADLSLFFENGTELPQGLEEAALGTIQQNWDRVIDQIGLRDISESMERKFVVVLKPPTVVSDGEAVRLYARNEDTDPPELHRIEQIEITGKAVIDVQEVSLTHMRLGEVRVSYGEVILQGHSGVVVASDGSGEETISFRLSGATVSTEGVLESDGPPVSES